MTVVCEGHRRRLTPPSNLWLVCEESVARARALWGGCPPHPPFDAGETSCFHAPACAPARSVDWENRVIAGGANDGKKTQQVTLAAEERKPPTPSSSPAGGKKSPGAIFRERSEPEGRVSGMIRAM